MKAGIARERLDGERRVAATPETVKQLAGLGLEVVVESGAGAAAGHSDEDYRQAGALVVPALDLARLDVYATSAHSNPRRRPRCAGAPSPWAWRRRRRNLPTVRALAEAGVHRLRA